MPMRLPLSRRSTLSMMGAACAFPLFTRPSPATTQQPLALFGPPAGPSVTMAHAVATGRFDAISTESRFTAWRSPDELRAGLTSGTILASVVPVQAAANLYNRGFSIRLANVMTNGLLYIASPVTDIATIPDLAGRSVAVPYRGDTPEILFSQLLAHHGLDAENAPDITYAGTPTEAMQMLLAGRVDAALTSEPATTAAVLRGRQGGIDVHRVIDLQAAWGEMTVSEPVLPQAGFAVTEAFMEVHGEALPDMLAILETVTAEVLADPAAAAANATEALGMPAPLLAASVPNCNLVARPATEARGDIERMLTAMTGPSFERIGGSLPDDAFYL